jgi:hypothetical protein
LAKDKPKKLLNPRQSRRNLKSHANLGWHGMRWEGEGPEKIAKIAGIAKKLVIESQADIDLDRKALRHDQNFERSF